MEILLEDDSDNGPKFKTKEGLSAIHLAAQGGHIECV